MQTENKVYTQHTIEKCTEKERDNRCVLQHDGVNSSTDWPTTPLPSNKERIVCQLKFSVKEHCNRWVDMNDAANIQPFKHKNSGKTALPFAVDANECRVWKKTMERVLDIYCPGEIDRRIGRIFFQKHTQHRNGQILIGSKLLLRWHDNVNSIDRLDQMQYWVEENNVAMKSASNSIRRISDATLLMLVMYSK